MEILSWFSDQSIMGIIQIVKSEYSILAILLGPGLLWVIKKFTGWTPWTSDDDLAEKIAAKFGLTQPKG